MKLNIQIPKDVALRLLLNNSKEEYTKEDLYDLTTFINDNKTIARLRYGQWECSTYYQLFITNCRDCTVSLLLKDYPEINITV